MNATTQEPQASGYFTQLKQFIKNSYYHLTLQGAPVPIPGVTGWNKKKSFRDQINASRSQRIMRSERGQQPEHRKARRTDRYALRMAKKRNSFCNNLDTNGNPIKN